MCDAQVELLWIPLGSDGSRTVRASGRVYERIRAWLEGRPACALYHSAPCVRSDDGTRYRSRWAWRGEARVPIEELPAPVPSKPRS